MTATAFDESKLIRHKNERVRYLWAGSLVLVLLLSTIGETIILIAPIKYRAFKLYKVIYVIIQRIALCDLLMTIKELLVQPVSVIAGDLVFVNSL